MGHRSRSDPSTTGQTLVGDARDRRFPAKGLCSAGGSPTGGRNLAGGPSRQVYAGWWSYEMTRVGPRTVMGGSKILIMPPRIEMVDQPAGTTAPGCVLRVIRSKKTPGGHTKQHQNTFR